MKLRIGVIGSSGGSALIAASECIKSAGYILEPIILSDRECGMTDWAKDQGLPLLQLPYISAVNFSTSALQFFQMHNCEDVLLYYTRRVASPLIDTLKVWNIHPSLLPSFAGLHGVKDALAARVSLFGATLHRVDTGLDTGPIVAQVAAVLSPEILEQRAQRLSYIQKVWLTLLWFEQISGNVINSPSSQFLGPGITLSSRDLIDEKLKNAFLNWLNILEPEFGRKQ